MSEREHRPESHAPLEHELLALHGADQQAMHASDEAAVRANTDHAKQLLGRYGWIKTTEVSDDAQKGLWLAVLHSDHDVEFQQQGLEKLQRAVEVGEAPKYQLAYLTDRVLRNTFQPQLFGIYSYVKNEAGEIVPATVEDEEHIEARWQEYDLAPHLGAQSFADYRRRKQGEYERYMRQLGHQK